MFITSLLSGCGPAAMPPDTDAPDTESPVTEPPVAEPKIYIFVDGSEEKQYENAGIESDFDQAYDKDAASLGLWRKPKENSLVISAMPENLGEYDLIEMDVFLNSGLQNGMRIYIYCGTDENGEETYLYKDIYAVGENWVTLKCALREMFSHGDADIAKAERIEILVNPMEKGLKQLYVRSVSTREYNLDEVPKQYEGAKDVYEYILNRFAYIEFGNGSNLEEEDHKVLMRYINNDCKTWWDRVDRECTTDPFGQNMEFTSANMTAMYRYIFYMAKGYATIGSYYYKNEKLRDDIIYCLDFMYENFYGGTKNKLPAGSNWWDSYIGSSQNLTRILLALRDELEYDQIKHYTDYMDSIIYEPIYTSANMIDIAYSVIMSSALQKDGVRLANAVKIMSENLFDYVTEGDGMYTDGSYIMHGNIAYTGNYGAILITQLSDIMYAVAGSDYAFSNEIVNRQIDWIFDAYAPTMWQGTAMSAVVGRKVWGGNENSRSAATIIGFALIAQYAPPERAAQIQSLIKYYLEVNPFPFAQKAKLSGADNLLAIIQNDSVPSEEPIAAKVFPKMARVTTHRSGFASMLSLTSPTVAAYEGFVWSDTDLENCTAWYTGAGMLYVYTDISVQYDEVFHRYGNRYRLAGTTIDPRERNPKNNGATYNESDFVGGVQMDQFALSAFQFDNKNRDFKADLTAKKSYFFFDDEYVMLGADITSTLDEGVYTTVENQKIIGNNYKLYLNDETNAISVTEDTKVSGVKYAYLSHYGSIVFPEKQDLTVNINKTEKADFSEIFFDHGVNPTEDTYSYIILPLASREDGKAYYENPDVEILSNTKQIQAVRENTLGLTGIVFWEAVEFAEITPDFACTVLVKETENGKRIAISDPTMKVTGEHTLILDGTYTLEGENDRVSVTAEGGKTAVVIDMTGTEGTSVLFSLKK